MDQPTNEQFRAAAEEYAREISLHTDFRCVVGALGVQRISERDGAWVSVFLWVPTAAAQEAKP